MHWAFEPQAFGESHGFLHLALMQAAESGQSELVKHSSEFLQPVLIGSPTKASGQAQTKLPG